MFWPPVSVCCWEVLASHSTRNSQTRHRTYTLINCVEAGKTNALRTRDATFDIRNRSHRAVQLISIAIQQRGDGLPDSVNSTVVRGPRPTVMRSGECQRVQLRFTTFPQGISSEFCARCVVRSGAAKSRWLEWLQKQIWLKVFRLKQVMPRGGSYAFTTKWTEN